MERMKVVNLDQDSFIAKAAAKTDPYEELVRRLPESEAEKITELKIPGVSLYKEQWRVYPTDSLAAHIIGFVGYDGDVINGRYGLERYYDDNLKRNNAGMDGNFFVEMFSNAERLRDGGTELEGDVVTTIEPTVERTLEAELKKVSDEFGSKLTGGIIMDPTKGEDIAAAAYPLFNPNR